MTAKILITRPDPEGQELAHWVADQIGDRSAVITSPLMRYVPVKNNLELNSARSLIFTSKSGVRAFAALSPRRDIPCYVVGQGTAAAARALGLDVLITSATSKDLLMALITGPVRAPCLYLRGDQISRDIVGALAKQGIFADQTILYAQKAMPLSPKARALLNREQPVILPLYSSRSADLFYLECKSACAASLYVAALSDAVRDHVVSSTVLKVAAEPSDDAMRALILQLWNKVNDLER